MKTFILPLLCISLLSFSQDKIGKKSQRIPIYGTVTETRSYCGGARPSAEMLTALATPAPAAQKVIYIKKGEVNSFNSKVLVKVTADENGNFHAKLSPGKYLIVDSTKKDTSYYNLLLKTYKSKTANYGPIDTKALKKWYLKPDAIFEVSEKETKTISVNFHVNCDGYIPCAQYRGPFKE